jgi:hydrogenase/urease accessory protein HupE
MVRNKVAMLAMRRKSCNLRGMMSSKRFLAVFASIFLLGSVPLLLGQPSGAASAGLSMGFRLPIEQLWQLALLVLLGVYASYLRSPHAMLLLPLSFVLMFTVGMSLAFDVTAYPRMPLFLLGAVLLLGLCFVLSRSEQMILGMVVAASFGFHFGSYYYQQIPSIAAPLYFMLGNLLAFALIFAMAVAMGLTFLRANRRRRASS